MKKNWNRAIIEKTTDLDGRIVKKIIYPDEKKSCKDCVFLYHDGNPNRGKGYTRCEKYPCKYWKVNQTACIFFKKKKPKQL